MTEVGTILDAVAEDVESRFAGYEPADVRSITYTVYADWRGHDAVRFRIILADRPGHELHEAIELEEIDDALVKESRSRGIARIPYTEFATESEHAESVDDGGMCTSPGPQV